MAGLERIAHELPEHLVEAIEDVDVDTRAPARRRLALTMLAVALIAALACVWFFTPLRDWIDLHYLVNALTRLGNSPLAPFAMIAAFIVGGLLVVPANLLIAVCVIVFGPLLGALYALIGTELSAWLLYEIGRRLPASLLRERFGPRAHRLRERVLRYGVLAVAVVRIVPMAPFTVVNLLGGAAHIPRAPYLAGTALGMLPGIVFAVVFIDRVVAAIEHPSPLSYTLLLAAAAAILAMILLLRRRLMRAGSV